MREQATTISEPFSKGLRQTDRPTRTKEWFLSLANGYLEGGVFRNITYPHHIAPPQAVFLGNVTFPFPQLIEMRYYLLFCTGHRIFQHTGRDLPHRWELIGEVPTSRGTWTVADFGIYFVMSNGYDTLELNMDTYKLEVSQRFPTAGCVFNFNSRLMLGGVFA